MVGGKLFVRVQRKRAADGSEMLYASVVENKRVGGKVVQRNYEIGRASCRERV